jgi:hypothetical protein
VQKEGCSDLLSYYEADGESVLSWVIIGDEMWIHHFELQTKRQWKCIIHLLYENIFKSTPSVAKVMATAF